MNESRVLSETIADEKENKISCMNENITEHETSREVFKMKILQRSDETTTFSKIEDSDWFGQQPKDIIKSELRW